MQASALLLGQAQPRVACIPTHLAAACAPSSPPCANTDSGAIPAQVTGSQRQAPPGGAAPRGAAAPQAPHGAAAGRDPARRAGAAA